MVPPSVPIGGRAPVTDHGAGDLDELASAVRGDPVAGGDRVGAGGSHVANGRRRKQ